MGKRMKKKLNESTTLSGTVNLYHFSREDMGEQTTLDPQETVKRRSSYSWNEYKRSKFPRVFYYTDLTKVEHQVKNGSRALYTTKVDGSKILVLNDALTEYKKNKEEFERTDKKAYEVIHALLGGGYMMDWDAMFETASRNYMGIFYDTGNLPMVNIFTPLKVTKYAGS
jgi:hypothetical protein